MNKDEAIREFIRLVKEKGQEKGAEFVSEKVGDKSVLVTFSLHGQPCMFVTASMNEMSANANPEALEAISTLRVQNGYRTALNDQDIIVAQARERSRQWKEANAKAEG